MFAFITADRLVGAKCRRTDIELAELFRWGGELVAGEWGAADVAVVGSDVLTEADDDRILVTLHDVPDQAAESLGLHLVLEPDPVPQLDAGHGVQRFRRLHRFPPGPEGLPQQVEVPPLIRATRSGTALDRRAARLLEPAAGGADVLGSRLSIS